MILTPETLPSPIKRGPALSTVSVNKIGFRFTKAAVLKFGLKRNQKRPLNIAVHVDETRVGIEIVEKGYILKEYNDFTTFTISNRTLGEFMVNHFKAPQLKFEVIKLSKTVFELKQIIK